MGKFFMTQLLRFLHESVDIEGDIEGEVWELLAAYQGETNHHEKVKEQHDGTQHISG